MSSKTEESTPFDPDPERPAKLIAAAELFAGAREVGILHEGALYRLKLTRQGKLILTK